MNTSGIGMTRAIQYGFWVRATAFDGPWIVVEETHRHLPSRLTKKHGYSKGGSSKEKGDKGKAQGKSKDKNP